MREFSEAELQRAFRLWKKGYSYQHWDAEIEPFLDGRLQPLPLGQTSRIKMAREGLFLGANEVSRRLGSEHSACSKQEERELCGTITLAQLVKVAEAMDCELVYGIRPKESLPFSKIIWQKLLTVTLKHPWIQICDPRQLDTAIACMAEWYMNKPKFRRSLGWSQRANRGRER